MARDTGLSLLNAADGAMKAMDFWQNMDDRKQVRGLRDIENKRAGEWHTARMSDADQSRTMREQSMRIADTQEQRLSESHNAKRARELIQDQEMMERVLAHNLYAADKAGYTPKFSESENEAIRLYPQLRADYDMRGAVQVLKEVASGKRDKNSPESHEALMMLNPEIQTGADDGRKRRISQVAPGRDPDSFVVALEVEGEDGWRPLTRGRSSKDDDPVMQVRLDDLIRKGAAAEQFSALKVNPEYKQYLFQKHIKQDQEPDEIKKARILQQEMAKQGKNISFDEAYIMSKTSYRSGSHAQGGRADAPRNIDKEARDHAFKMTNMAKSSGDGMAPFNQDEVYNRYYSEYLQQNGVSPPQPPPSKAPDPKFWQQYGISLPENAAAPSQQPAQGRSPSSAPQPQPRGDQPAPELEPEQLFDPKLEQATAKYLEVQQALRSIPAGRAGADHRVRADSLREAAKKLEMYIKAKGGELPDVELTANGGMSSGQDARASRMQRNREEQLDQELAEIEDTLLGDPVLTRNQ